MTYFAPYSADIVAGDPPLMAKIRAEPMLSLIAKRVIDYTVAILALVLALPVIIVVHCLVRRDGGPCLFAHTRLGMGGKPFRCLKFRTMVPNSSTVLLRYLAENPAAAAEWAETCKLKNDPRVTPIGRVLRRTSLDELPQLINIIRGEMSLVGPRPITDAEATRYGTAIGFYQAVRPGITGLWQVCGRSGVSYERRVQLDSQYVQEWTLWKDIMIVAKTIPVVLSRDGAH